MTRRPWGAAAIMSSLVALATCAIAQGTTSSGTLTDVADYLEAFTASYQPAPYEAQALADATAAAQRAAFAMAPALTFEQELAWNAYASLMLDLTTQLRLPLYDSRAAAEAALSAADMDSALASAAGTRAAARQAFFIDLATYSVLAEASADLTQALESHLAPVWLADPDVDPLAIEPSDRDLFEGRLRLLSLNAFLADQRSEVLRRLARTLRLDAEQLTAPAARAVREAVPRPPSHRSCMEQSSEVTSAYLRHRQSTRIADLHDIPVVKVELTGNVGVTLAGAGAFNTSPLGAAPSATVALQASLALPDGRPFGPNVDATVNALVSPAGASQTLRISWPRPPLHSTHAGDPDEALADELELIAANLRGLRRSLDQAAAERIRLERALAWLDLDTGGALSEGTLVGSESVRSGAAGREPAGRELGGSGAYLSPVIALHAADLRAQLAFAELDEVVSLARLASACGAWP